MNVLRMMSVTVVRDASTHSGRSSVLRVMSWVRLQIYRACVGTRERSGGKGRRGSGVEGRGGVEWRGGEGVEWR